MGRGRSEFALLDEDVVAIFWGYLFGGYWSWERLVVVKLPEIRMDCKPSLH